MQKFECLKKLLQFELKDKIYVQTSINIKYKCHKVEITGYLIHQGDS